MNKFLTVSIIKIFSKNKDIRKNVEYATTGT
jgi:hypothetical protein